LVRKLSTFVALALGSTAASEDDYITNCEFANALSNFLSNGSPDWRVTEQIRNSGCLKKRVKTHNN